MSKTFAVHVHEKIYISKFLRRPLQDNKLTKPIACRTWALDGEIFCFFVDLNAFATNRVPVFFVHILDV